MPKQSSKPETAPKRKPLAFDVEQPASGKQTANQPETEPAAPLSGPEPLPQRNVTEITDRISMKLADGKIDTASMRAGTAATFKSILKASMDDPEFRNWAGIETALSAQEIEVLFTPEQAGMLLDIIVMFEAIGASAKTALTYDECKATLGWSAGEHEILDKQVARLVQRYVPVEWLKKIDLVIFILMFLSLTAMKMRKLSEEAKDKLERIGKAGERPVGIAPASTPAQGSTEQAA